MVIADFSFRAIGRVHVEDNMGVVVAERVDSFSADDETELARLLVTKANPFTSIRETIWSALASMYQADESAITFHKVVEPKLWVESDPGADTEDNQVEE